MEKDQPKYSLEQIDKARAKESVILRWQGGEKLVNLIKSTTVRMTRCGWWKLKKLYQKYGFSALLDKRGGRVAKIGPEIRTWIKELKQEQSFLGREKIAELVKERFGCTVSLIHLSRILKEEGIHQGRGAPRKEKIYDIKKGIPVDCAGCWFLKGADSDMEGIKTITEIILNKREEYLQKKPWLRILHSGYETIVRKNETLLYLPIFGMERPYHLDKYHKRGLGLLVGSGTRYGYETLDKYLCEIDKIEMSKEMSKLLARCYIEALCIEIELKDGSYFYIDGHAKHVWSSKNIPKVFFTTLKRAERGLHQFFINSSKGHPLILLTCPGDSHLTKEMFNLIDCFENAVGKEIMKATIFDREGLSLAIFEEFDRRKKYFITLLRDDQYKGIENFEIIEDFIPLKIEEENGKEKVVEWVAEAKFKLKDRENKKGRIVRVALVKKEVRGKEKLIAIITNIPKEEEVDIRKIAKRYFDRWPNQENIFKDMMSAIKSDSNHGYKKNVVENRVMARRKEEIETNIRGFTQKINSRSKELEKKKEQLKNMKEVYESQKKILREDIRELHVQITFSTDTEEKKNLLNMLKANEEKLLNISEGYVKHINELINEIKNSEQYLKSLISQRDKKERELKGLNLQEVLVDMKTEKDHIMSNFKILLTNLSSYVQEQYFPQEKEYQNATLETMIKIFYRQDGYVKIRKRKVEVTLYSYDVPELQKAVEYACMKFNASNLYTLFGQRIQMQVES